MEDLDPETFYTLARFLSAYTGAFQAQLAQEEREREGTTPSTAATPNTPRTATKNVPSDTRSLQTDSDLAGLIDFG